jgi:hypothetical protein
MHMNHGVPSYATSPVTIAQLQMVRSGVFLVADHPIKSPAVSWMCCAGVPVLRRPQKEGRTVDRGKSNSPASTRFRGNRGVTEECGS